MGEGTAAFTSGDLGGLSLQAGREGLAASGGFGGGGGGAGGSVLLKYGAALAGNGTIRANGGRAGSEATDFYRGGGGGGGGGRVVVVGMSAAAMVPAPPATPARLGRGSCKPAPVSTRLLVRTLPSPTTPGTPGRWSRTRCLSSARFPSRGAAIPRPARPQGRLRPSTWTSTSESIGAA